MQIIKSNLFLTTLFIAFSFSGALGHCDECDSASSSAFVLSPQIIWLDNGPLKDLIAKERYLRDLIFNLHERNPVFMLGFGAVHERGNGLSMGFSFYGGYKSYQSKTFTGGIDALRRDSIAVLRLIPAYCGFTFDKNFRCYDMSFTAGIMIGGGVFILNREYYDVEGTGPFNDPCHNCDDVDDKRHGKEGDWAFAGTAVFDVHAGISFKLAPLLSVGIESSALCFYSPEGYGYATGEFFSVSPGLTIRLKVGRTG